MTRLDQTIYLIAPENNFEAYCKQLMILLNVHKGHKEDPDFFIRYIHISDHYETGEYLLFRSLGYEIRFYEIYPRGDDIYWNYELLLTSDYFHKENYIPQIKPYLEELLKEQMGFGIAKRE